MKWIKGILICLLAISTTLSAEVKMVAFAGSTREGSSNKKLVLEAAECARQMGVDVTVLDLKNYPIPLYDGDLEVREKMPINAKTIRQIMIDSDFILISSPSYNGSLSGLLKNILDWTSRDEDGGASYAAYSGKKFLLMSASPGAAGGAYGLTHLREILEYCGGSVNSIQVSLPNSYNAFDEKGHLKNEKVKADIVKMFQSVIK